ncbi:MAG: archaeosortase/exosortase family protein [Bacteroidales bacterium]|nr:archaeosortase/exosortase family protein [Bacteroidales bacterium]
MNLSNFLKIYQNKIHYIFNNNRKLFHELFWFILSFLIGFILMVLLAEKEPIVDFIKNSSFTSFIQDSLIIQTRFILNITGYQNYVDGNFLQIHGTEGVVFVFGCLGIRHFALFSGFIIVYPGKILNKLWFILSGIIILHFLNLFRIILICITQVNYIEFTGFVHYYVSRIIMYSGIFILWLVWMNLFSTIKSKKSYK